MSKRNKIALSVFCPLFNCQIILHKANWISHVEKHPEIRHHLNGLIKDTLEKPGEDVSVFVETDPPFEHLVYRKTHYFLQLHEYLKIAVKLAGEMAYIKSVYPVYNIPKEGIIAYERK